MLKALNFCLALVAYTSNGMPPLEPFYFKNKSPVEAFTDWLKGSSMAFGIFLVILSIISLVGAIYSSFNLPDNQKMLPVVGGVCSFLAILLASFMIYIYWKQDAKIEALAGTGEYPSNDRIRIGNADSFGKY